MSDLDTMLEAHAGGADIANVDSLLAAQANAQPAKPVAQAKVPLSKGSRFAQGLGDTEYGVGQLVEHVPVLNTITKGWRLLIQESLKASGFNHAAEAFNQSSDTSGDITDDKGAKEFDHIVSTREKTYQEARKQAGQDGIDWWRFGGQAANPLNYLAPEGAAASAYGRIGQAAIQGGLLGAEQPATTEGNFWGEKAAQVGIGSVAGGVTATLVEAAAPAMRVVVRKAREVLGKNVQDTSAAEAVLNDALRAKGIDPETIDLDLYSGMKQEVRDALESGAEDISPQSIVNRARAESLPSPVRLMRGQATGDPSLYSTEQNLRGVAGVGEPVTQRLQEQNRAFIENLDLLGAKDAPDPVSTSQQMADGIQKFWDQTQAHKDQLYDAVRNSRGLPALVDGKSAAREIREQLSAPEAAGAWKYIPQEMKDTLDEMESGKLPVTVSTLQNLDKFWGQDAARASGPSAGSASNAINQAREILSNAQISDDIGQESMQAYQLAKQAHAQQMSLVNPRLLNGRPNPNYQPLVKAVVMDGKADDLFQKGFMGASPSVASKNLEFLSNLDPSANEVVGRTFMGEIKRQALSSASDERGTVSQTVLAGWARDPVKAARMEVLMPDSAVQTFRNLADTIEVAKRFPVASTVNTSNTGSSVINAVGSALKSDAATQITKRLPVIRHLVEPVSAGMKQAETETAVQGALKPGVTLKSLLKSTPKQAANKRLLSRLATPAAVSILTPDKPEQ